MDTDAMVQEGMIMTKIGFISMTNDEVDKSKVKVTT